MIRLRGGTAGLPPASSAFAANIGSRIRGTGSEQERTGQNREKWKGDSHGNEQEGAESKDRWERRSPERPETGMNNPHGSQNAT
jgi:hypothetical protein